jgi:glycosyltransferase involved in cell wall biosynthesis
MYEGSTVGVVVPAYDEQGLVGAVIETILAFVDRIYVVDDCSTDGTWAEIQRHAATTDPVADAAFAVPDGGAASGRRVVPIRHDRNRGVGGAIRTGYRRARADGNRRHGGDGRGRPDGSRSTGSVDRAPR